MRCIGAYSSLVAAACGEEFLRCPDEDGLVEQCFAMWDELSLALVLTLSIDPPAELAFVERNAGVSVDSAKVE